MQQIVARQRSRRQQGLQPELQVGGAGAGAAANDAAAIAAAGNDTEEEGGGGKEEEEQAPVPPPPLGDELFIPKIEYPHARPAGNHPMN